VSLDEIRARLTPGNADEVGYLIPQEASHWAALTDEELFRLRRKVERENLWNFQARVENELTTRLIQALTHLRQSSDDAAKRLETLTWTRVGLTIVIAAFTVALFFRG